VKSTDGSSPTPTTPELIRIHGKKDAKSHELLIAVKPGQLITEAVRVYAEPSHTLVSAVMDIRFAKTAEGKEWLRKLKTDTRDPWISQIELGSGLANVVHSTAVPAADDHLKVYAISLWPDGTGEERLLLQAHVPLVDFNIGQFEPQANQSAPQTVEMHCIDCVNGSGKKCANCDVQRPVTFCNTQSCCAVICGEVIECCGGN
jgi:hypothetical protein